MAILSNVNGKFAVDSTGAIQFSGQTGTSGYVLKSNGNAAPTWVDGSTVIGGPYLPLAGGTLTGATATASGISFTVGGTLTGTSATFSGTINGSGIELSNYMQIKVDDAEIYWTNTANNDYWRWKRDASNNFILDHYNGSSTTAALTFNSTQNATFAGAVTISKTSSADLRLHSSTYSADFNLISGATGANKFGIYDNNGGAYRILIDSSGFGYIYNRFYLASASNQGNLFFGTADAQYNIFGGGTYGYMGYNTGGYHRFLTSGTERMRITSAGDITLSGGDIFLNSGTNYNDKGVVYLSNERTAIISDIVNATANGDTSLDFQTRKGGTRASAMFIDEFRNVGITAAASFRFNSAADNTHAVGYDSTIDGSFLRGQLGMRFLTGTGGGAERMRITSAGEVNIGGFGGQFPVLKVQGLAGGVHTGSTFSISANQDAIGRTIIGTGGQARAMYFENDGKTVHTQESSFEKDIGIGIVNQIGVRLYVDAGTDTHAAVFRNDTAGFAPIISDNQASSGTRMLVSFRLNNTEVGKITSTGSSTVYATSSDYRLKEDLKDFAGLDMVSKIPVYDFKWKTNEIRSYGVVAHELQEILPEAVSGIKDEEEMQGVDYGKITPILIKAIQELEARIKILENK